jgi:hypothetical protein
MKTGGMPADPFPAAAAPFRVQGSARLVIGIADEPGS